MSLGTVSFYSLGSDCTVTGDGSNAADNGPDQGQPLAAAGDWRTDGAQREPEMLIEVRGAVSRCFSAPQGPIRFSPVQPPLLFA